MTAFRLVRILLVVMLAALALGVVWLGDIPLGLDFQGGARLRYELEARAGAGQERAAERALEVFWHRLDALEVGDVSIHRQGPDIVVETTATDAESLERLASVLGRFAQLRFVAVDDESPLPPAAEDGRPPGIEIATETVGGGGDVHAVRYLVTRGAAGEPLSSFLSSLPAPEGREWILGVDDVPGGGEGRRSFLVTSADALSGERVADAEVILEPSRAEPVVMVRFDTEGARQFEALTARLVHRRLAIVLDGLVRSAPVVQEPIRAGAAQVTLGAVQDPALALREAQELAITLRSGALPSPARLAEQDVVAPALDGTHVTLAALVAGGVFLVLCLLAFLRYRSGGLVVAVGVPATVLLSLAVFAVMEATLTSYSVAGIAAGVLAMLGSSVFALERARLGHSYGPASAIVAVAAHAAALFAGLVLFSAGAGPVRGLAAGLLLTVPGAAFVALAWTSAVLSTPAASPLPKAS